MNIMAEVKSLESLEIIRKNAMRAFEEINAKTNGQKYWGWENPKLQRQWQRTGTSLLEAIQFAQENTQITFSHKTNSKLFGFIVEDMLNFMKLEGINLDDAPHQFCESSLSSPKILFNYNGRNLSTDFLYRYTICSRIKHKLDQKNLQVLEIGGGLGNLSRCIKLFNATTKYCIIDLPETLFFSYSFLSANFPESTFLYVTDAADFSKMHEFDFVFVPFQLYKQMPRFTVDLLVNTHSIGEMPQDIIMGYMDLIQNHLDVKCFYSLNRYLEETTRNPEGICSLVLDPYWKTSKWTFNPIFTRIDRVNIPVDVHSTLELLLDRIPESERSPSKSVELGKKYFQQAQEISLVKGYDWHRLMWESVRLYPHRENVETYYEFLANAKCREYKYFYNILKSFGVTPITPPPEKSKTVENPELDRPLYRQVAGAMRHQLKRAVKKTSDKILNSI